MATAIKNWGDSSATDEGSGDGEEREPINGCGAAKKTSTPPNTKNPPPPPSQNCKRSDHPAKDDTRGNYSRREAGLEH